MASPSGIVGAGRGISKPRRGGWSNSLGRGDRKRNMASPAGDGSVAKSTASTALRNKGAARAPLTHFICLPIGHHAALRDRIFAFTSSLLSNPSNPIIEGLDKSVIVAPRRLHLTLGVMSLRSLDAPPIPASSSKDTLRASTSTDPVMSDKPADTRKTLDEAKAFLFSLHPQIISLLRGSDTSTELVIPLEQIDIMPPEKGDLSHANVLYAGPLPAPKAEGSETIDSARTDVERLTAVCNFIERSFISAGFVIDQHRPLKLHCTLINTIYRKPRSNRGRAPFDYLALLRSSALQSILTYPAPADRGSAESGDLPPSIPGLVSGGGKGKNVKHVYPVAVDLGRWRVDQIQICEMGSSGPEGEYKAVAAIDI